MLSTQIITGIIASLISFLGIVISSYINSRQIRLQESNVHKQLQRTMTVKLYELRLKLYPRAFEITEKIKQKRAPIFINPKEELFAIYDELIQWKNGEVSLVLSAESLYIFGELCTRLHKLPAAKSGNYTSEQAENILKRTSQFRRSLRKDLGFLFGEDDK